MTSEQPSLGPQGSWVTPPSALLLYHLSPSERLRPLAEVEGWAFSQPLILYPSSICRSLEQKAWPMV